MSRPSWHVGGEGRGVYRLALQDYAPDRYRILCMNCQFIEHKERSKLQPLGDCSEANE